jgi:inositol phosphorylceramide mannosyltransferase catalytic subunit
MDYLIPKRIIQICCGKRTQPSVLARAATANVQLLNSDYEYLLFDDHAVEDFLSREYPQYRRAFDSFQYPIQRYDFLRYLAVYHYGGFYFDLDVLLAQGLSSLLRYKCVFPFERLTLSHFLRTSCNIHWQIGNYAFGAAPRHPFIGAVIENCLRAQKTSEWIQPMLRGYPFLFRDEYLVLNSTGPLLLTRTFAENSDLATAVTILFPQGDIRERSTWYRFGDLGIHLMEGSWRRRGRWLQRRLERCWESLRLRKVMKQRAQEQTTYHPSQSA